MLVDHEMKIATLLLLCNMSTNFHLIYTNLSNVYYPKFCTLQNYYCIFQY